MQPIPKADAATWRKAGGEFQCAYHGWRFATDGTLTWVYDEDDFPQGNPCGNRNLVEIPCDTVCLAVGHPL